MHLAFVLHLVTRAEGLYRLGICVLNFFALAILWLVLVSIGVCIKLFWFSMEERAQGTTIFLTLSGRGVCRTIAALSAVLLDLLAQAFDQVLDDQAYSD